MNNTIMDNGTTTYYVVSINGITQPTKHNSQMLAEMEISKLNNVQQESAVVVPVTADGKQILLG